MKKKLFSILALFAGITFGYAQQVTTIDFDDDAKWTAGSGGITSYQVDHVYESDDWHFTGGPAMRQNAGTQDGEDGTIGLHAWRLRDVDNTVLFATYQGAEVIAEIGFKARRWDSSPDPNWEVSYSTDGGTNYTLTSVVITNASLDNSSAFKAFSFTIDAPVAVAAGDLIVKIERVGGERIMVDDFSFTVLEEIVPPADLMYYWHFNDLPTTELVDPIAADYAAAGLNGSITYPGTGSGYLDIRTYRAQDPVSNLNLHLGQSPDAGAVLRVRNPSDTRDLVINAPATGFQELKIDYAVTRSGSGAEEQEFFYSVDGGVNWISVGTYTINELNVVSDWTLISHDLSSVTALYNNADAQFKISSLGANASLTSGNTRLDNFTIKGEAYVVVITPSVDVVATLNPFNQLLGSPSTAQQFSISGTDLAENVTVTAPTNYEISFEENDNYTDVLTLVPDAGEIATSTIYVRLAASQLGVSGGDIVVSSTELASDITIAVTGETTEELLPQVFVNANLVDFAQILGTPSAVQSFTISGEVLTNDVTVAAPAGYEISLEESSNYATSLTLSPIDDEIASTTIFVRLNATSEGQYNGDIVVSTDDLTADILVAVVGETQLPAPPSITVVSAMQFFNQFLGTPSPAQSFTVGGTDLVSDISLSVPAPFEISLTADADFDASLDLVAVAGVVATTTVYVRLNAEEVGVFTSDILITADDLADEVITLDGETEELEDPISGDQELIYYWHFNQAIDLYETIDGVEQIAVPIPADFAATGLAGSMVYEGAGSGYVDVRTFRPQDPVSNLNLFQGQLPDQGAVLRLRNPAETKELIVTAPTTGYKEVEVAFAIARSGNGATEQSFFYSIDNGTSWVAVEENYAVPELTVVEDWVLMSFDLSTIAALDDNDEVLFKITFEGDAAANPSGNNRLDNFSVVGKPLVINTDPTLVAVPSVLNFFEQTIGAPSDAQFITVSGTNLLGDVEISAPVNFEISLDEANDYATSLTLTDVVEGVLAETTVYVRLNMAAAGIASGVITVTSEDATTVEVEVAGESEDEVLPIDAELIYYWHFNNLSTLDGDVKSIAADYSLIPGFVPDMVYTGESNRDMDEYDNGSSLNLQLDELAGKGARVRNSSEGRSLVFNLSTAGVADVVFEYAVYRSGSGMLKNIIDYSTDAGATFTQAGLVETEFDIEETYKLITVNFEGIAAVNNNPNFLIRIRWEGNTELTNGNNRYDNITLKGTNNNVSTTDVSMEAASVLVYPNPAVSSIAVKSSVEMSELVVMDVTGKVVYTYAANGFNNHELSVADLQSGVYIVQMRNALGVKQVRFVKQ